MKKVLLFIITLLVYFNVVANDHFYLKYSDGSVVRYDASYQVTDFNIDKTHNRNHYIVFDMSVFDDSKWKSRADYNRIKQEIKSTHDDAIYRYITTGLGQEILV